MNKNTKVIVMALAALLVLGGAVLLLTLFPEAGPEATEGPAPTEPIPPLTEETYLTVTHILVTLAGGGSYEISPVPGDKADYTMNTPAEVFPWNHSRVRDVGTASLRVSPEQIVEENVTGERLKDYGLDKPASRVKLTRTDGTATELLIGRQAPSGTHYYAMRAGTSTVCLIRAFTAERLLRTPDDMRDYSLFKTYTAVDEEGEEFADNFIAHFSYLSIADGKGITLEIGRYLEDQPVPEGQVRVNKLYLSHPLQADGHDYAITSNVLEPLLTVSVSRIVEKNPADWSVYGLDDPAVVTLRDEEGWELELHIGSVSTDEEAGRFLRLAGTDFVLLAEPGGNYKFLNQDPFYLRATTAWARYYDLAGIDQIRYEHDGKRRVQAIDAPAAGDTETPFVSSLDGVSLSETNGRRLYRRLLELTLDGPYKDDLPGIGPDVVFSLHMKDGTEHILSLYSVSGGRHYAVVLNGENQQGYMAAGKINRVFEALDVVDAGGEIEFN